jgi:putative nucleotidyltransferase with HDIG domain
LLSQPSDSGSTLPYPEPISPPEPIVGRNGLEILHQQLSELEALHTASTDLHSTIDWDQLIPKTLAIGVRLAAADSASLMILDEHSDILFVAQGYNLPDQVVATTKIKIGEGIVGWVAEQLTPLLLIGPVDAAQYPKAYPKPHLIGSSICAPLITTPNGSAPHLIGVLNLSRAVNAPHLTQDDLRIISTFCSHAATALHNARQFRQAQHRANQSQHLIEVSRHLAMSLDSDTVLRSIMDKAVELLHCQSGSLLLVDDHTQELVFKVVIGPAAAQLTNLRLPPGVGVAGTVARQGSPLIVNDAKADPRHYAAIDNTTAMNTRSLLCVPLINKQRVIGVLEVMNKNDGTVFDQSDCDILTAFAFQSAIALGNAKLYSELRRSFADTVRVIANAVEARDVNTAGHTIRVTQIALEIARELGWSQEQLEILEIGALLHDIGKIGMPDGILHKPAYLTEEEYRQMKQHPIVGAQMLTGVDALRPMLPYILYHQERYDGKGYPFGLTGEEIPIEGRLLAVADTFDAMTSDRPYRNGLDIEAALAEIVEYSGTQFDPTVVDALVRVHQNGKLRQATESSWKYEQQIAG